MAWALPPKVNHNVITVVHTLHYVLAGYDERCSPLRVCIVHTSLCFVTDYDGWYEMCASVYMMHSLFCQTVIDEAWIGVDGRVCASTCRRRRLYTYVDELTCSRAAACARLVWASGGPCLEGDELSRVRRREGGTGSVRALLASLSGGRHWEWLADPLPTLVRHTNPSSWLKMLPERR